MSTKFWRSLAGNPSLIWGECKSSGLTYYKVAFHKTSSTFKCNCPSRKFPCKHALALSILLTDQSDHFAVTAEPPEWVNHWLAQGAPSGKMVSPEAEAAKAAQRQKNYSKRLDQMTAGLDELENWLLDTLRQGIATLAQQPYSFWKDIAARMYDAKLSAIGKRLKAIPILINSDDLWPEKILSELTSYFLLIRGLRKMDELPLNIQQDLLTIGGVTTRKDELFQYGQAVKDTWMTLGTIEGVEDRLNFRRTWILGHETKRYGLILDYAFGRNPFPTNYKAGNVFVGTVVFYPSNAPLRVALKEKHTLNRSVKRIVGFSNFNQFLEFYAQKLALNPWLVSFPCSIENVIPVIKKETFFLVDSNKKLIPVINQFSVFWKIIAVSGGQPIHIFGEWTGTYFLPFSMTIDKQFISF